MSLITKKNNKDVSFLKNVALKATFILFVMIFNPLISHGAQDRLSKSDTEAVKKIIYDYIMENPNVIVDALRKMQEKEKAEKDFETQKNLKLFRKKIFSDLDSPSIGNPKGDVTIVEFFDYRCGYCKRVLPTLMKALEADPGIRLVFKEYPILGPKSVLASKIALSVWLIDKQKYEEFHSKLMKSKGDFTKGMLLKLAASIGISSSAIEKRLDTEQVKNIIRKNYELAQAMNLSGTPAFIIGEEIVPGAIDTGTLKRLIKKARKR